MSDDPNTPDPQVTPSTATPPSQPQGDPEALKTLQAQVAQWERKYNGLQGSFQNVQKERDTFKQQVEALTAEYEGNVATATANATSATERASTLETENATLKSQNEQAAKHLAFLSLLSQPDQVDLIQFQEELFAVVDTKNLEGDAITEYLTSYRERVHGANGKPPIQAGAAAPPPPDPKQATQSLQDLKKQMDDLLYSKGPGSAEYKAVSNQYMAALAQQR